MLTVDLIETFINTLSLTSSVVSHSNDGTNTTITVSNIYHARYNMTVDVDGTDYTVVSVNHDTETVVVSGVIASPVLLTIPNPFYFHGTPYATSTHISKLKDISKVPMIYLVEILRETRGAEASSLARTSDLNIHFLDVANYEDWNTDQHYSNVLVGLKKLVDAFITALQQYPKFYAFEVEFTEINHVKWGQYLDRKGHVNSIFNERLTGIELDFSLPIRKDCN